MVDFLGFESTQIHRWTVAILTPTSKEDLTGMFSTQELSTSASTITLDPIVTPVDQRITLAASPLWMRLVLLVKLLSKYSSSLDASRDSWKNCPVRSV
jgi:hypothetical protein